MTPRPKQNPRPGTILRAPEIENGDTKDRLLCQLEQQQTIHIEKIEKLERQRDELESLRKGFALVYERSPVGYITFDNDGHIYNVNETALRLLGYDRDQFLHLPLAFLIHPKDCRDLLNHLLNCSLKDDGSSATIILRLRSKDHRFVNVQLVSTPFAVVNGRQTYLTAVVDMTEHDRHERTLAETRDFAEAIVDTVRNPLAVLDSDLKIVSVNCAFTEFFHRPAQYVRGRTFEVMLNLWRRGNALRHELEKVLVRGEPLENYRLEVEPLDVGRRILLISARPLRQKVGPQRLLVSLEDATELESTREALRKTNEELEQRVAARTEALHKSYEQMESFCYSIAHDLRAPLRSMTGFSQLLVDEFAGQITETGKDYAGRIQHSAERMDHLIRDLLSYGRLNTAPLATGNVDLEAVFREVIAQHDKDIHEKHAKVRRKGRLPAVYGHHAVVHAVLANLICNGLKFVAPGVRPRIEVSSEKKRGWARVWVVDNGIGIAPENRGKIFGVFQRLHSQETYPGTGIGLAIVAKGIERMGGQLGLESEPGKGSRFWFELPVRGGVQKEPPNLNGNEILIGSNQSARTKGSK